MPNDTLRAAITEYKIRRKSAEDNLARHRKNSPQPKQSLSNLPPTIRPRSRSAPLIVSNNSGAAFDASVLYSRRTRTRHSKKSRYDGADLPDIVDDHWHYLVKGIGNEPSKAPIWFNWSRLGGKQYEIEVPAAAHEKFFRPMFDGQLPTVGVGSPVSPNQDAAPSGSISDNAQPTANASPT